MEPALKLRSRLLHRRSDTDIAASTKDTDNDGSIAVFPRLTNDIPALVALGLVGNSQFGERSFWSCLPSSQHNTMGLR